jgi:NTP pyrophosphatase (non-canonical NTP hydrolase)
MSDTNSDPHLSRKEPSSQTWGYHSGTGVIQRQTCPGRYKGMDEQGLPIWTSAYAETARFTQSEIVAELNRVSVHEPMCWATIYPEKYGPPAQPEASTAALGSAVSFFGEIFAELERATSKFPTWPTDPIHASSVVQEEAGELARECNQLTYEPHKSTPDKVRKEAVQLAAMAIRFLMSMDRYEYTPGRQHSQTAEAPSWSSAPP